jgi:hypothetical protein
MVLLVSAVTGVHRVSPPFLKGWCHALQFPLEMSRDFERRKKEKTSTTYAWLQKHRKCCTNRGLIRKCCRTALRVAKQWLKSANVETISYALQ